MSEQNRVTSNESIGLYVAIVSNRYETICAVQQLKVIDDTLKCNYANAPTLGLKRWLSPA